MNASTLTMATPIEFGVLNDQSEAIRIEGSQLRFEPESIVSLSAGSIHISGGELIKDDEEDHSVLIIPAGEVHLQATGNVSQSQGVLEQSAAMSEGKSMNSCDHADSAEQPQSLPGRLVATGNAGSMDIRVEVSLHILNGGQITSSTYGEGNAGTIEESGLMDKRLLSRDLRALAVKQNPVLQVMQEQLILQQPKHYRY